MSRRPTPTTTSSSAVPPMVSPNKSRPPPQVPIQSVTTTLITRLDASPVRRRRQVMQPTPLVYAMNNNSSSMHLRSGGQSSSMTTDDYYSDRGSITTSMATTTSLASAQQYRPPVVAANVNVRQTSPPPTSATTARKTTTTAAAAVRQQQTVTNGTTSRSDGSDHNNWRPHHQEIRRQMSDEYRKLMSYDSTGSGSGGPGGSYRRTTTRTDSSSGGGGAVSGVRTTNGSTTRRKPSDNQQTNGDISNTSDRQQLSSLSSSTTTTPPKSPLAPSAVSSPTSVRDSVLSNATVTAVTDDEDDDVSVVPKVVVNSRQCNRYGFFMDSNKTDVVPELTKLEIHLLRKREKKWIQMLDKWDKYINNRWAKVRDRCRKGIPHSMRGQAWLHLCGGHHQIRQHPDAYGNLCRQSGDPQIVDEIRKDIHRQFPNHELFDQPMGTGQRDLLNVLKAFSILKPDIGYCQGQAPIASVLLMHMPAEHAFWSLVAICDHYLPGYFSPGLEAIQLHGDMLFAFIKRFAPNAHKLMEKQKIEPILFMTEWFMCVFARTLPWPSVLRVWDMFLCEGIKIVFKCAIVLVSDTMRAANKKTCPSMYETLERLRQPSHWTTNESILVDSIVRCDLHDGDLQREHNIQEKRRSKQKQQQKTKISANNNNNRTNGKHRQ
ncbi:TBC1 domain family member whacked-like [Oppia nitens]|uniref:TBC1 domain family member whacked-like n=1 Tax=Oppia nitens TaxID=1686743 RepID=UPI0023DA503E|nr:TBC1 domain family member whacked-like [Oppia nitens]